MAPTCPLNVDGKYYTIARFSAILSITSFSSELLQVSRRKERTGRRERIFYNLPPLQPADKAKREMKDSRMNR